MRAPVFSGPTRDEARRPGLRSAAAAPAGAPGRSLIPAYLAIAGFMLAIDTVNVLTLLHDEAVRGERIPAWEPMVWEYTSGAATVLFAGLARLALGLAPPGDRRWLRLLAVHGLAAVVFSLLHVAGMNAARLAIYAGLGLHYPWRLSDLPYELRKDVLSYLLIASVFWVSARLSPRPAVVAAPDTAEPATFDIVDGARTWRTPVGEIVALRSAGNYVEFRLVDGAVRLMRTTLAELERGLAAHGFVRVHRSWIVNARRLRLLEPSGSGDYRLSLDGGVEAPVSRRYPAALARLKGSAPTLPP